MLYPVNSGLMYLRSINLQFNLLCLLTALYLLVKYRNRPSRLHLIGIWLALLLCVGTYEAGYALIVLVPLYWWFRDRKHRTRNVNVSVIWYLIPALKLLYLALLVYSGRSFYRSNYVYQGKEFSLDGLFRELSRMSWTFTGGRLPLVG